MRRAADWIIHAVSMVAVIIAAPVLIPLIAWQERNEERDDGVGNVIRPGRERWERRKHEKAKSEAAEVISLAGRAKP